MEKYESLETENSSLIAGISLEIPIYPRAFTGLASISYEELHGAHKQNQKQAIRAVAKRQELGYS